MKRSIKNVVLALAIGLGLGLFMGMSIGQELATRNLRAAFAACNDTVTAITRIAEKQIQDKENYILHLCTPTHGAQKKNNPRR
ncbi:MAG: hypothetical protein QXS54_03125 [Candidatus Methanomethylicaceae archaeon]